MSFCQKTSRENRINLLNKIKVNKRLEMAKILKVICELDKQIALEKCLLEKGE